MKNSKVEIWYRDIDPDTGKALNENKICTCENHFMGNWIKTALNNDMSLHYDNPNREIFFKFESEVYLINKTGTIEKN